VRALVVLGGADGAITTLRTARRLGLRTICVDQYADAPAVRLADEHLHVSTRDGPRLVELLSGRADLAGVVSPASDVNLPTQHLLADRLGLPCGLSAGALRASVDKGFFRELCDRLGQPGPRYVQGAPDRVRSAAAGLPFPVIVKPTDSSGGRGVSHCRDRSGLAGAVERAAASSPSGVVIAEEYLAGRHYTAEAVVRDGRIALFGVGRRVLMPLPYFVTVEHTMPGAPPDLTGRIRRMLDEVCQAMDYRWGSLNVDVLVTADRSAVGGGGAPRSGAGGALLVELGARIGGNGSAELLGLVSGVDVTEAYVRMAVGERPSLAPAGARLPACSAFRALRAALPGRLVAIRGLAAARGLRDVVDLVVSATPGDQVEPYHRAGAKVGYVLVASPDRGRLRRTLAELEALLRVEVAEALPVEPSR
jgi:biotin carboxylase